MQDRKAVVETVETGQDVFRPPYHPSPALAPSLTQHILHSAGYTNLRYSRFFIRFIEVKGAFTIYIVQFTLIFNKLFIRLMEVNRVFAIYSVQVTIISAKFSIRLIEVNRVFTFYRIPITPIFTKFFIR